MASIFRLFSVNFMIISIIFLLSPSNGVNGIPEPELEAMLSALRSKGYNLFGNAIMTSDIRYEILAGSSFTFFAPTDSSLFSLDMTATALVYVMYLRYHIVHRRFSISDLRTLPLSGSSLPTLVSNYDIHVASIRLTESDTVAVNGVDIVLPGLFYGRNVAVHGLIGILNQQSMNAPAPEILFPPKMNAPDGISSGPSPMQRSPVPNDPDSASVSPEYGFPVNHSDPPYSEVFPPNSQTSVNSSPDDSDPYLDGDYGGYSRRMQPKLKKIGRSMEESQECGNFRDNSALLREDGIQATAPEFSFTLDEEVTECRPNVDETVKDNDLDAHWPENIYRSSHSRSRNP